MKLKKHLFTYFKYFPLIGLFLAIFLSSCSSKQQLIRKQSVVSDNQKWSERMAQTLMIKHPNAFEIDDKTTPKWDYVHGLVMSSFEQLFKKTNNPEYYKYIKGYADATILENGTIPSYKMENYNIDMIVSGNILFFLYDQTKEKKYLLAMQTMREQLKKQPRTSEGGFWHKKIYPNQMWLDGLYMGSPFYARYTTLFENGAQLNDVARQFDLIQKNLLDPKTGLLFHGWDEQKEMAWADKQKGTSANFWSRSLGWYAMALVDVLDFFPKNHPKRNDLLGYLNSLASNLLKFQHASGLWYQVTDKGMLEGNYLEASGSAMFAYAFAKGANKGYLPKEYKGHAHKTFDGITTKLMQVTPEGFTILTNVCAVAGLGGTPFRDGSYDYYINERKKDNDPKATGPFILAALELNK